jgi:hypothetical protein
LNCVDATEDAKSAVAARLLSTAATGHDNVHVLDLNDIVCVGGRCVPTTADGVTIFRDERHLTNTFVESQAPEVQRRLAGLGLEVSDL